MPNSLLVCGGTPRKAAPPPAPTLALRYQAFCQALSRWFLSFERNSYFCAFVHAFRGLLTSEVCVFNRKLRSTIPSWIDPKYTKIGVGNPLQERGVLVLDNQPKDSLQKKPKCRVCFSLQFPS